MENNTSQPEPFNELPFYKRKAFIYLAIACIALIITGVAAMFHKNYPGVKLKNFAAELINMDIPPGGNKAVLTLASGKMIILNEAADGELGREAGLIFRKTGHAQLFCEINPDDAGFQNDGFHTITTPKGGTYQITLPDGSKVWLNAGSILEFSVSFLSNKVRKIKLSGEAYLEVIKDSKHQFIVETDQQLVKVVGTRFNMNNYNNDPDAKTTLFEGSINVSPSSSASVSKTELTLKACQQAIVDHGRTTVIKADTTEVLAWKNGLFIFENEKLESIMKKISRWYDAEVIYQDIDKEKVFSGKVSRFEYVSTVLKQLELTGGLHFKIQEGKIIVMK